MLRASLLAFVALACVSASHAATICDRRVPTISPMTAIFPMYIRTRSGANCDATFSGVGQSNLTFKRLLLVMPPARGRINLREGGYHIYTVPAGVKDQDTLTLRVCGSENKKPGCATLNHEMTVE